MFRVYFMKKNHPCETNTVCFEYFCANSLMYTVFPEVQIKWSKKQTSNENERWIRLFSPSHVITFI